MYARVTPFAVTDDETDDAASIFEQLLPTIREFPGYVGSFVLADSDQRNVTVVTIWASAEDMAASDNMVEGFKRAETASRGFRAGETTRHSVVLSDLPRRS